MPDYSLSDIDNMRAGVAVLKLEKLLKRVDIIFYTTLLHFGVEEQGAARGSYK